MLRPLEQFICDECGRIIENPQDGYVEWEEGRDSEGNHFARGFRIVHNVPASPRQNVGCFRYENSPYRNDIQLDFFLENVNNYLMSFLDLGIVHDPHFHIGCRISNFHEFVEFFRRLTIPYYEEARRYFPTAIQEGYFEDVNELVLYTPDYLRRLITRYNP